MNNNKSQEELKIYYQNVRSIKNKIPDLDELIISKTYDIMCFTETWLTPDTLNILDLANQQNWHHTLHVRNNKRGGGTLILAQPHVRITKEYISKTNEIVQITITGPINLNLTLLYNPPGIPQNGWDSVIDDCINKSNSQAPLLILGDFNDSDWTPAVGSTQLAPIFNEHGLEQMINFPTRGVNFLDLALKRNVDVSGIAEVSHFTTSDHKGFELVVTGPPENNRSKVTHRQVRDYYKTNWTMLNHQIYDLGESNCIENFDEEDLDKFIIKLFTLCENLIPKKKILENRLPWMDTELKNLLLKKNRLHKVWKIRRTLISYEKFKDARREFKQANNESTKNYLLRNQEKYKSDPKAFWKTLRSGKEKPASNILKPHEFANYFSQLVKEDRVLIDHNIPNWQNQEMSITDINIDINTIYELCISNNFASKSSPDIINGRVLKNCAASLAPLLSRVYSRATELGYYPKPFKKSSVFPLHKNGIRSDIKNYRQITIQPLIGKLFDKLIYNSIYAHVTPQIADHNHYCIKKRSVNTNLLCTLAYIVEAFENSMQVDVIYADIAKAFDNVSHKYLIQKLKQRFGFAGKLLALMESYLNNRCYFVKINEVISDSYYASKGIPQGSILSPLLFTMFTNDLYIGSECKLLTYADDVKIMRFRPYNQQDRGELQKAVDKFHKWTNDWALTINTEKTKLMTFSQKKNNKGTSQDHNIYIEKNQIQSVNEFKDLGVIFDSFLTFKANTVLVNNKLRRALGYLNYKFGWLTSVTARKLVYNACFTSQLEYGLMIWVSAAPSNLENIKKTQIRSIKRFLLRNNANDGDEYESVLKRANILNLEDRATMLTLNVIKNGPPRDMEYLAPIKALENRYEFRNKKRYLIPAITLSVTQRTWKYKLPNFLNALPDDQYHELIYNNNWKFIIKFYLLTKY